MVLNITKCYSRGYFIIMEIKLKQQTTKMKCKCIINF